MWSKFKLLILCIIFVAFSCLLLFISSQHIRLTEPWARESSNVVPAWWDLMWMDLRSLPLSSLGSTQKFSSLGQDLEYEYAQLNVRFALFVGFYNCFIVFFIVHHLTRVFFGKRGICLNKLLMGWFSGVLLSLFHTDFLRLNISIWKSVPLISIEMYWV